MRAGKGEASGVDCVLPKGRRNGIDVPRIGARIAVLAAAMLLGACAALTPPEPAPAPKVETLPELMHQAETAAAAGEKDKAREAYRAAAKVDPTSKAPWLKLSESYFESGDYGNAVLAAQEVLHRDGSDSVAAGILAVSGLRVSTAALAVLRQQNHISAGTRGEAQTLAGSLRELLGEPVLVPRPEPEPVVKPVRRRVRPSVAVKPPAPKPQPASTANPPAVVPTAAGGNPFDKLK